MKKIFTALLFVVILFLLSTAFAQDLEVHFINVGQGDSILVKTPGGKAILIDAGIHYTPSNPYNPFLYLQSHGISRLDAIFITHPHDDHYKGFKYLCTKKGEKDHPVGDVYYSVEPGPEYGTFEGCLEQILNRSDNFDQISARGPPLVFDDVTFTVLYPKQPIITPNKNKNLDSIVMRMTYKNVSFIFTGDTDKSIENVLDGDLKSDVLKVGHHGSSTASGQSFLKKVSPEYAIISSDDKDGKGKTYGHPHASALKALKSQKVKLYRTDLSGNVVITSDGEQVSVSVDHKIAQNSNELWKPGAKAK